MVRFFYLTLFLLLSFSVALAQDGELQGRILDTETGEGVPFANVIVEQSGAQKGGSQTDFDGYYSIKPIQPGKYDVRVSYVGYQPSLTTGVLIGADKASFLDIEMSAGVKLTEFKITAYKVPLISKDNTTSGASITREEIANLPTREVGSIASTSAGVFQQDDGEDLNVRGSRDDGTDYYIDGIRVRGGANLPQSAIEQIDVVLGGIPAKYGDAIGGIINITTRGASREFHGGIEGLTSQYLDDFGYNLISGNLSGPIIKNDKRTVLGFFLAGEFVNEKDSDPSALGINQLNDEARARVEANPYVLNGTSVRPATEFLQESDFEVKGAKQNVNRQSIQGSAKLDFAFTEKMTLTLGSTVSLRNRKGYDINDNYYYTYSLLNSHNMPQGQSDAYRGFARFTHKLGGNNQEEKNSVISNAYYSLQFDYTKTKQEFGDQDHMENVFLYGHTGFFDENTTRNYANQLVDFDGDGIEESVSVLQGYSPTGLTYSASDYNPDLSSYITAYQDLLGGLPNSINELAGTQAINGGDPAYLYGLWRQYGKNWQNYRTDEDDQYRLSINGSFDIKGKSASDRAKHSIELGMVYEQRIDRAYSTNSLGVWSLMRQLTNSHIGGITQDTSRWEKVIDADGVVTYIPEFELGTQTFFDKNLRDKLGISDNTQHIELDMVDPTLLSYDMFTADDLLNSSIVGGGGSAFYYGYDYTGKKLTTQPAFEDYWTEKDVNGNFTRPMAAFQPIYAAGYIQDKFSFKDIIFNVGVRVDRFDANQKVLKDPYSLYAIKTVDEVSGEEHPSNISSDAYVYRAADGGPIAGYREEGQWFDALGNQVAGANFLGAITPDLVDPSTVGTITSEQFDVDGTFKDYAPQITVMPRLAFSFPIADEALFYAHYDVLAQRPSGRLFATPHDYFIFGAGETINNGNLKSEKTVDYEVGFRQTLSSSSAIKVSAFYKDLKDMIQYTRIQDAYFTDFGDYFTYGNIDFGNVKGFSFEYDLRRTNNLQLKASYTLQFAEGTGSSQTAAFNFVSVGQPNLKTIIPFDYDQRHTITVVADYRYGSGANYDGPRLFGKNIFSNAGINLVTRAASGRPYSRAATATANDVIAGRNDRASLDGGINGSRLPWSYKLDLSVDKQFNLTKGENPLSFEIYLQIQNLLNTKNIVNVYSFTGTPDDDGYLASAEGSDFAEGQTNPSTFTYLYGLKANNPGNFSQPRRIKLGAILNF